MSRQNNPPITVGVFNSSNSWSGIPSTDHIKGLLTGGVWGNNDPDDGNKIDLLYIFQVVILGTSTLISKIFDKNCISQPLSVMPPSTLSIFGEIPCSRKYLQHCS